MSNLSAPHFHNEEAAYEFVEARVWPYGATCPKCGERKRVSKMQGNSTRIGAYKCYKCRTLKFGCRQVLVTYNARPNRAVCNIMEWLCPDCPLPINALPTEPTKP